MLCSAKGRLVFAVVAMILETRPAAGQSSPEGADGDTEACFGAAERAQPLLRQLKFREARAELDTCARDACPRVAREDCRAWLADLSARQPTVVVEAHQSFGDEVRDVQGVRATVDGGLVVERADAEPFPLDPGSHHVVLEHPGAPPVSLDLEIHEGEKGRAIAVTFQQTPPPRVRASIDGGPAPAPTSRPVPATVYAAGALGLAALGVGTYFEIAGLSKRDALDSQCRPTRTCAASDVDRARAFTIVGDASLGGGALFLLGATVLYLTRPVVADSPKGDADVAWSVGPAPGGGGLMASVRGSL